jgi:nitrate/TMAO reductase-like tetraheme cytochrome c subunit
MNENHQGITSLRGAYNGFLKHDVHITERPAASYSERCIACHPPRKCGMYRKLGDKIAANCVDCHMPVQESNQLVLDMDEKRIGAKVRNHWIKIYAKTSR